MSKEEYLIKCKEAAMIYHKILDESPDKRMDRNHPIVVKAQEAYDTFLTPYRKEYEGLK
jgi:hypothetical protein